MRGTWVLARNSAKCGMRSKGLWISVIALTVLPLILLHVILVLVPRSMIVTSADLAGQVHGEDAAELFEQMSEKDYQATLLDMAVTGSMKLIGSIATLMAVFFTTLTNEAARKSIASLLAHPIRRGAVVLGSFLGTLMVVLPAVLVMTVLAFALYYVRAGVANWGLFPAALYTCAGVVVVTAYSVALTTLTHAAVGSFGALSFAFVAAQTDKVVVVLPRAEGPMATIGQAWLWLVPRLGDFGTMAVEYGTRVNNVDIHVTPQLGGPIWVAFLLAGAHVIAALTAATIGLSRKQF